ncbi:hypothetical protein OROMI_009454 [Orobanche minor]
MEAKVSDKLRRRLPTDATEYVRATEDWVFTTVQACGIFQPHEDMVEDVRFNLSRLAIIYLRLLFVGVASFKNTSKEVYSRRSDE